MLAATPGTQARPGAVVATAALDTVLVRFAHEGRVDYRSLAADPGALHRYLAAAATARPGGYGRSEQMAFWINTYNARVLDAVLRRPGLKSVLDSVAGLPGVFREGRPSGGQTISLDQIERMLRESFRDARAHFVLNCASASCP